ncbi:60S ribosomal protein L6 [Clonorchis sinensis]|uniref:Large ribosomal subunit protein eL6 n=2 Tax=Clonorchis sinensis TaxID=79923 RepID=H2KUE2_CLOSI|nr:60S ribosomal protein L6 [Clonorchis sinensis]GAA35778.1 large subunit ribosomal protein L6e [Clonorchis sinensis]
MSEVGTVGPRAHRAAKRRVVSGKRYLEHKKFIQRINRRLKAKNEPRAKGRYPVGKAKVKEEVAKKRFPRSFTTQQGKSKLRLRKAKCFSDHKRRIRPGFVPGTVLILLAGPHKGKRVVFLKALRSGLLLVTGPFKYNGVPLRRINQRYAIATQTRIDLSGIEIPKRVTDEYFKRVDLKEDKRSVDKLLTDEVKKYSVSEERKEDQKVIDSQVSAAMKKHPDSKLLHAYLRSLFSLGKRDYPHRMIF